MTIDPDSAGVRTRLSYRPCDGESESIKTSGTVSLGPGDCQAAVIPARTFQRDLRQRNRTRNVAPVNLLPGARRAA